MAKFLGPILICSYNQCSSKNKQADNLWPEISKLYPDLKDVSWKQIKSLVHEGLYLIEDEILKHAYLYLGKYHHKTGIWLTLKVHK